MFHPTITGAKFDYETPSAIEVLESGLYAAGAPPAHIAIVGAPVSNSVRCYWHGLAMTNAQREDALRFILDMPDSTRMPAAADLQVAFDHYAADVHTRYRDAMQANFNHLVNGGALADSRMLACHVDYGVSE